MPNISLRDLDSGTLTRIKSTARRQNLSVNRLIVETLRQHYASGSRAPDGLDALAGSWTKEQAEEFNVAIAPFGEIDAALWAAEPKLQYRVEPVGAASPARPAAKKSARRPAAKRSAK